MPFGDKISGEERVVPGFVELRPVNLSEESIAGEEVAQ